MQLFHLARRPTREIRIALVAMLLALGLNAIAHASHPHDSKAARKDASALHASSCGLCTTFGAMLDAPHTAHAHLFVSLVFVVIIARSTVLFVRRTATSANPRAPPHI